ncbi:S66 peptidase family protein [Fodinibius halophilus]|uniref:LD-carboxypeptidase n=1 Tax=Fodinibius halophilus TaxID=1736908 RepID=A0A6M1T6Z3_9BACT|nr:LD-carboxypeptidase [Fodinibius halophilus]NGP89085.1 LD-carboxypeptidase [Fodinibius halophilus]
MDRKGFLKFLGASSVVSVLNSAAIARSPQTQIITKPKRLQKGDTVGLISPSSRLPEKKLYNKIVKQIKELGYKVKEGSNARNQYGYLGGTDDERAADLNAMFADDEVDAIIPFRGGWGANRILDAIDYDLIKANPKILVGFSDITSLLLAIYAKTGLITFHGPVGKSDWTGYTTTHFEEMVSGQQVVQLEMPAEGVCSGCDNHMVIRSGRTSGRLLGGNLSVLTAMAGSDYLPDWQGNILFLEDVGEDIYRIDRMITQLKLSGILDQISGFVFGQCTNCERSNSYSLTLEQVFDDHIKPLGIPAFSGAMFGHISKMVTLPVGLRARINAQTGTIRLNEIATIP